MTGISNKARRVVVDVDSRGRVSLARFGIKDTQLVVEELETGGLMIHEAVVLTPLEAAHYADPNAVAALDRALGQVEAGQVRKMPLHSD